MEQLEIKRMKLELIKVAAARHELEFRIEERMDEIGRIKGHIQIQEAKEKELADKIASEEKALADKALEDAAVAKKNAGPNLNTK